jgi:tetratricopeptide (TPR) repeat protein
MNRILVAAAIIGVFPSLYAEVRVWQGILTLPVYTENPPDINPPFDIFSTSRFNYPYTLRTSLTGRRETKHLRALYLENEYLKCSVLPDIGGHLYSCTDKLGGEEMFYANPSIKKALIGYRGAWAAFGIEFNFPVSHNWMSMSPVDFTTRQNPDGSASIFVGNIDLPYGMQWMIELVLRPGSTILEERVTLYNRSYLRHRYYYWNNAGVEITNDSRIEYPMRFTASHGFTYIDTWPVNHEGKDISIIRNHTSGPVSQFVYGSREPFMGVWHPHNRTGVVHYADYADLPGKKIWSFGVDADGLDWRRALSDDNSGYVEVQAGPFRNQETYAFLPPQEALHFSEYWMPVRGIGGISRANLEGVVNLRREGGRIVAGLNVNHRIPGASVRLRQGERVLAEQNADLAPDKVFTIESASPGPQPCTFELKRNGKVLLAHTEGLYAWTPKSEVKLGPQEPVHREADSIESGQEAELNGDLLSAAGTYARALEKDPDNFELNKAAGRLAVALKNYPRAVQLLSRAQYRRSNDPEIEYYLGHAYWGLGEFEKARAQWEGAQRQPQFRPQARVLLARLDARQGDVTGALRMLSEALSERPRMVRAGGLEVALLRSSGAVEKARERLDYWRHLDPTSSLLWLESVKLGRREDEQKLWRHLSADPQRVLEIAVDYIGAGLYRDALDLLSRDYPPIDPDEAEPGTPRPQENPLVVYYRAYCHLQLKESAREDLDRASHLPTRYVFPYRPETMTVLRAAVEANPGDATARFLLGSEYMSGGMTIEAVREWEAARRINPRIPVLHRNLGRTLLVVNHDEQKALEVFREGISSDPGNVELYTGISQTLGILRRPAAERVEALEKYPDRAHLPTPLVFDLALSLAESGRFNEARSMFKDRFFEREEGGTNVRQVFLEVQLLEALALAKQGRAAEARALLSGLGKEVPGLPFTKDGLEPFLADSRFEFYLGRIEDQLGGREAARERWRKAASQRDIFSILASRSLGEPAWRGRAESFLSRSTDESDASALYRRGMLLRALGRTKEANDEFAASLRQPDRRLSHYMARRALAGLDDVPGAE